MPYVTGSTISEIFHKRIAATPVKTAYQHKVRGQWKPVAWADYGRRVRSIAHQLLEMGLRPGDRVAILSQTRPEWALADLATITSGAITVPVYPSLTGEEIRYILNDCGARFCVFENASQVEKLRPYFGSLTGLEHKLLIEGNEFPALDLNRGPEAAWADEWKARGLAAKPSDLASIVYTSGTSGQPKGACLTHANFVAVMTDTARFVGVTEDDVTLLFLPVAHVLGRIEQMITLGAGWVNSYGGGLVGLLDDLLEVRPTVFVSVPRIYEKIYSSVLKKRESGSFSERAMLGWALEVARKWGESGGRASPLLSGQKKVVDRLVFEKVRERFGGRLRFAITGGAPISRDIADFFSAAGVLVLEGYGLTETTGPIFVNPANGARNGTVGRACPGAEAKIDEDGEILLRGPTVFTGYLNLDADTSASLTPDGWFRTGDVGSLSSDGYLKITDRKKDLLITAGGKNIAPQKIENLLTQDTLISQAIVVGDRMNYLSVLVALAPDELKRLARDHGWVGSKDLTQDPRIQQLVKQKIQSLNSKLAPFETLKKFRVLPRELSLEAGELTPSLKIKRKHCVQKYASLIAEMYDNQAV